MAAPNPGDGDPIGGGQFAGDSSGACSGVAGGPRSPSRADMENPSRLPSPAVAFAKAVYSSPAKSSYRWASAFGGGVE